MRWMPFTFRFRPQAAFRHLLLNLCYNGAGKIYWTEQNDMAQDFYGTLNGNAAATVTAAAALKIFFLARTGIYSADSSVAALSFSFMSLILRPMTHVIK